MGWAACYIKDLQDGKTVQFRPRGSSMSPLVKDRQLVTVAPFIVPPKVGDIVLCRVYGADYLHLVKAVQGDRFQIGNNRGHINGWITTKSVFGVCTKVER